MLNCKLSKRTVVKWLIDIMSNTKNKNKKQLRASNKITATNGH